MIDFEFYLSRSIVGSIGGSFGVTVAGFSAGSGYGSTLSELRNPSSLFLDTDGTIYILDTGNNRVMKYLPGEPLGSIVAGGNGAGTTLDKLGTSYGLFLDDQLNIYISEYSNHRVTMWLNGNLTGGTLVCSFQLSIRLL